MTSKSLYDQFFVYGRVGIDEWDWRAEGKALAKRLMNKPEVYVHFDAGKLMGMFLAIDQKDKEVKALHKDVQNRILHTMECNQKSEQEIAYLKDQMLNNAGIHEEEVTALRNRIRELEQKDIRLINNEGIE